MLDLLRAWRSITATPGHGCTRIAYTHYEDQAHDLLWDHLQDVPGLSRLEDAAGNTFIVPAERVDDRRPVVLIGSHLDTVLEGGWLDGALGVAAGAYALRASASGGSANPRLGLVVFRDEEGLRFSTGLFGSKVFAGLCGEEDLAVRDERGVRVGDVVRDSAGCRAYDPPVRPAAYLECHIEQGGRLLASGRRVAVVNAIVGIRRFDVVARGEANHAGTTEMTRRVDALVPVADLIRRLPTLVEDLDHAVITCGQVRVEPGAANIVPGRVKAIVELRAGDMDTLEIIEHRLRVLVSDLCPPIAGAPLADVDLHPILAVAPVPTHEFVNAPLIDALREMGLPFDTLPSMAGHDAQFAAHRCPAGMFFIPSLGGRSHHPAEDSREEDVLLAGRLMHAWARRCVEACS